jgi:hypothetical protein
VKDALHDARCGRERLAGVARTDAAPRLDALESALESVRRRVVQVAAGLADDRPSLGRAR